MDISKQMQKLRENLDHLNIDYKTDDYEQNAFDEGAFHYEHTVWNRVDDGETSVVYIYFKLPNGTINRASYGSEDQLECWMKCKVDEPMGMDVDDIIKLANETGQRKWQNIIK